MTTFLILLPLTLAGVAAAWFAWRMVKGLDLPPLFHDDDRETGTAAAPVDASAIDRLVVAEGTDVPTDGRRPWRRHTFALPFAVIGFYNLVVLITVWRPTTAEPMTASMVIDGIVSGVALLTIFAALTAWSWAWPPRLSRMSPTRLVAVGLLAGFAAVGPALAFGVLFESFGHGSEHALIDLLRREQTPTLWAGVATLAVVLAPLLEELEFRLVMQTFLSRHINRPAGFAIVLVWFAAVHGPAVAFQVVPYGIAAGVLFLRTQSYLAVVVAHMAFNGSMLGLLALTINQPAVGI